MRDTDGDGYPDEVEVTLGSDPNDPNSTPGSSPRLPSPDPLDLRKLQVALRFDRADRDRIQFRGTLPIPEGFDPAGREVVVSVGGAVLTFELDERGRATLPGGGRFRLRLKRTGGVVREADAARLKVTFPRGSYAAALADEGLVGDAPVAPTADIAVLVSIVPESRATTVTSKLRSRRKGTRLSGRFRSGK